jgi:hypothetical protein
MFGLITRRRHKAELDALRSQYEALRERCEIAESNEATERAARRTITRQFAEADAANRRLEGRLLELGRRLAKLAESDPEYAARLERRVARLLVVGARLLAAYTVEKRRADRLASHLDSGDLKAIKQWEARVQAHDEWKPDADSEQLIEGGWPRPTHPATELRQALERCRLLQAQLDASGKRVAS